MEKKYVKNINELPAYRLSQPDGHDRTASLLVDGPMDGARNVSMGLCVIDPESGIPRHVHETEEEAMYVLDGRGAAIIGGSEHQITKGSIIFCPPKIEHQILNSEKQKLCFLFVYGPAGPEQSVSRDGKFTEPLIAK